MIAAQPAPNSPDKIADDWQIIAARAPQMASTMGRYLTQASTFLAPRSIDAASIALRQLAFWLIEHTDVTALAAVTRDDVEDFTVWLADQPGLKGPVLSANTRSQRLHMLRTFFARIMSGTGTTPRAATRSSKETSHPAPTLCPGFSMTTPQPS